MLLHRYATSTIDIQSNASTTIAATAAITMHSDRIMHINSTDKVNVRSDDGQVVVNGSEAAGSANAVSLAATANISFFGTQVQLKSNASHVAVDATQQVELISDATTTVNASGTINADAYRVNIHGDSIRMNGGNNVGVFAPHLNLSASSSILSSDRNVDLSIGSDLCSENTQILSLLSASSGINMDATHINSTANSIQGHAAGDIALLASATAGLSVADNLTIWSQSQISTFALETLQISSGQICFDFSH